ncbi:hypothetical protein EMIHUDRAFT_194309 [Emiliania huxleyi CCMP1516]|uniref:Uncharacterized protein n=2 Tax=Emiliania huxleyi TaxID=2903 RepID=A0A0D3L1A5_EMIH1|nr:hypothetical protein EMIHUDRAFT_194309 [Emiliania huxleyi CCMP1516]EOD41790.1 hypothetical protein EMIHUDRAFT_194309 [Emiliania huxleyi CCMP1516]|eukprot:XP_005794219.1 hypothetical protein EMIHUDRAFT_194309 [Emiliania huxleyi CCMP1516]
MSNHLTGEVHLHKGPPFVHVKQNSTPGSRAESSCESGDESGDSPPRLSRDPTHLNLRALDGTPLRRRRKPEAEAAAPQAKSGTADAAPWVLVDASAVAADRALPHILSSYRPEGCTSVLRALFTLHNQSLNIYTHLLGLPYVASFVIAPPPSSAAAGPFVAALRAHAAVALLVGVASDLTLVSSCGRQLLLAIDQGPLLARRLLIALAAAALAGFWSFVSGVLQLAPEAGPSRNFFQAAWNFPIGALNSRPKAVVAGVMGLPLVIGLAGLAAASPTPTAPALAVWAALFAVTVAIWVLQIPERWFAPGTLDLVANSHNWMHVLVIVVFAKLQRIYTDRLSGDEHP